MVVDNSLTTLLGTLTSSLDSAAKALPEENSILPPKDGISLLDVKNDLLLAYLQNLVFLILLKLRDHSKSDKKDGTDPLDINGDVVKKLVELRVYIEKGVRPLENRLKYQIDKVVRAAEDSARTATQKSDTKPRRRASKNAQNNRDSDSDVSDSGSEGLAQSDAEADELAYGPNVSAFARAKVEGVRKAKEDEPKDGIYRPPRIHPTSLPITQGREEKGARRSGKSATLDEFIATELSGAPVAEPSIGSTIVAGGRRMKSQKEREDEAERREYEESNFVRLPKESKKDLRKKGAQSREGGWGGEEWRGLDAGLDRIERLTQKKSGASGSLAKSRKRPISDGPRGTGAEAGEMFEKRRKVVSRHRK
jgi:U3 small nucleolar ribonucleoprotein protein LCP5